MSRGSALVDSLVAVFVAALLLQGAMAAARLQAGGEAAEEAAAVAAAWAARYGDTAEEASLARALAPDAESISVGATPAGLAAVVTMRVPLAGPGGSVAPVVVGRVVVAVSPYRSNRD